MGSSESRAHSAASKGALAALGEVGVARCKAIFARMAGEATEAPIEKLHKAMLGGLPLWALRNLLHEVHRQAHATDAAAAAAAGAPAPRVLTASAVMVRNDPNWRHPAHNPDATITVEDLAIIMADTSDRDPQKRRKLYYSALRASHDDSAHTDDVYDVVLMALGLGPDDPKRTRLTTLFDQAAFRMKMGAPRPSTGGDESYTGENSYLGMDEFERLLDGVPMAEMACNEVMSLKWCYGDGFDPPENLQPLCFGPENVAKVSPLLDGFSVAAIDARLPAKQRGNWSLLFSSKLHGGSFSTLRGKVLEAGSSVLVIRDKDGYVFGGYACNSWKATPDFYGSESCFLFRLEPELMVFPTSGKNKNYQYFNYGMEQLPNGLGFGGQQNYFGLFVSDSYTDGHSKGHPLSTTYSSVVLSMEQEFKVAEMEVWRTGPHPGAGDDSDDDGDGSGDQSILEDRAEEMALLELAGIEMKSTGLREPFEEVVIDPKTGKPKRVVY